MALAYKNFSIRPGATKAIKFIWYSVDSDTKVRTPIDLTSYTGVTQIRPSADSDVVLLELSTANGRMSLSNTGEILLLLSSTITSNYTTKKAFYDTLLTETGSGIVIEFASGIVSLDKGITR